MLGLEEAVDCLAKANGVCWYGHVLRRDEEGIEFEVCGTRRGQPKKTWKEQVEESRRVGLRVEDALYRAKWREGVRAIAANVR